MLWTQFPELINVACSSSPSLLQEELLVAVVAGAAQPGKGSIQHQSKRRAPRLFLHNFRKALTAFLEHGDSGSRTERAWAPGDTRRSVALESTTTLVDVSS